LPETLILLEENKGKNTIGLGNDFLKRTSAAQEIIVKLANELALD
jgi:hypothetical protein